MAKKFQVQVQRLTKFEYMMFLFEDHRQIAKNMLGFFSMNRKSSILMSTISKIKMPENQTWTIFENLEINRTYGM